MEQLDVSAYPIVKAYPNFKGQVLSIYAPLDYAKLRAQWPLPQPAAVWGSSGGQPNDVGYEEIALKIETVRAIALLDGDPDEIITLTGLKVTKEFGHPFRYWELEQWLDGGEPTLRATAQMRRRDIHTLWSSLASMQIKQALDTLPGNAHPQELSSLSRMLDSILAQVNPAWLARQQQSDLESGTADVFVSSSTKSPRL